MTSAEVLPAVFRTVLQVSIQGSALIIVVLVIQRLLRRWVPAGLCYALWFVVMLRLLMPTLPSSSFSWMNLLGSAAPNPIRRVAPSPEALTSTSHGGVAPLTTEGRSVRAVIAPAPGGLSTGLIAAWIWIGGMAVLALLTWRHHRRISVALRRSKAVQDSSSGAMLVECCQALRVRRPVDLLETDLVSTPSLFGAWRPRLLLPRGLLQEISQADLRLIFLHELTHVRRLDPFLNWIWLFVQTVHWFNPLVWCALRRMRDDRELACDASVLHQLQPADRHAYGIMLIRLTERFSCRAAIPGLISILNQTTELKRRILMISAFKSTPRMLTGMSAVVVMSLGLITLTGASEKSSLPAAGVVAANPVSHFADPGVDSTVDASTRSLKAIEEELQHQKALIADRQSTLDALGRKFGVGDLQSEAGRESVGDGTLRHLESLLLEARGDYERRKTLYNALSSLPRAELKTASVTAVPDPILSKLFQTEADLELRMVEDSVNQGPKSPTMQGHLKVKETIERQIKDRLDGILAGLRVQVDSDRARADSLRETLEKHKAEMAELAQQRRPYDEVRRELKALEAMRERLEDRLTQERIEVIANPVVAHKRTLSGRAAEVRRSAVQVVDVSEDGKYRVAGRQVSLEELTKTLKEARNASPDLVVELRMVDQANFQNVAALLDRCQAQGIANVSLKIGSKSP